MKYLLFFSALLLFSCQTSSEKSFNQEKPWQGVWQMVGFDETSVSSRDTLIEMSLNEDETFGYKIFTRDGNVISDDHAIYKINDQHSIISVFEDDKKVIEYFIRKVDKDSLIFQSDTFSIKWKRVN